MSFESFEIGGEDGGGEEHSGWRLEIRDWRLEIRDWRFGIWVFGIWDFLFMTLKGV
jgi:hypothetical protein